MAARRIKYAPSIQYFEGCLTMPGAATLGWSESEDNPLSPHFKPLEVRTEAERARWWANHNRRAKRSPACGVFD